MKQIPLTQGKFALVDDRAEIEVDAKRIKIGCFETEKYAARAYNEAAIKYHGEFARLNKVE